jgi:hypothetical protein
VHLADIAPSIFAGLGLKDTQGRMNFDPSPHGRECLLLVDGLGLDSLLRFSEYAPTLARMHRMEDVETAFPSTTATSLTTLMTGELPGVHGMLGYTVRVPRSGGRILNSLKWDERVDPVNWQSVPTLFERGAAQGIQVSHVAAKRYESTGFTRAAFRGAEYLGANVLAEMIEKAKHSLMKTPSFTYVYINELDVAGHSDGVGSEKWLHALAHVDHVAESLMKSVPNGTRLWITSDHGMINVGEKIVLGKDNRLLTGISAIAGEPRARHLYLDDHHLSGEGINEIVALWRDCLGDSVEVFSKAEAHSLSLFGTKVSADADDRMGDIIAIAKGEVILIDPERENLESMMVGHHGARTRTEKFVPLLMSVVEN